MTKRRHWLRLKPEEYKAMRPRVVRWCLREMPGGAISCIRTLSVPFAIQMHGVGRGVPPITERRALIWLHQLRMVLGESEVQREESLCWLRSHGEPSFFGQPLGKDYERKNQDTTNAKANRRAQPQDAAARAP